ncbi:MAG: SusE domain-containing protein [Chryseolinea sp.]
MKHFRKFIWYLMLTPFVTFISCDDEQDLNLKLTEVKALIAPENDAAIALKPSLNLSVGFQWDQARAEDGSLVLYEVAFDVEGGNFSAPFYSIASDGKGVENRLALSHSELNKIASLGGTGPLEKKKFIWTVLASKGSNVVITPQSRTIELERPNGLAEIPTELYVTGSASETGTGVSEALPFKQTESGIFEIYTKLAAGAYKFIDEKTTDAKSFYVREDDGIKIVGQNGEATYDGDAKVYRIVVDFNALSIKMDEIKSVGFWYSQENSIIYDLEYSGAGVWIADNKTVNLTTVPWGLEERHKYQMVVNDGVEDKEEWWGYKENDSPGQDGKYATADPSYFEAFLINGNDQWNYTWKLDRPAVQGKVVDFMLKVQGNAPYRMEYVIQ